MPTIAELYDLMTRSLWTFVQTFLASILTVGLTGADLTTYGVAALAGIAAVLTVLRVYVAQQLVEFEGTVIGGSVADTVGRVIYTFLAAALSVVAVNGADLTDLTLWQGAAVAGATSVLSLVKTVAGVALEAAARKVDA